MSGSIKFLTVKERAQIDKEYMLAQKRYAEKYPEPIIAKGLIREVYNQIYQRETEKAFKEGKDGLSAEVQLRIDALELVTETKLLNESAKAFEKGESLFFNFKNNMPDEQTAQFFNLADSGESFVNISRTGSIRLPDSFNAKNFSLEVSSQGENLVVDDRTFLCDALQDVQ